ncbi:hypothetical protein IK110_03065 [Candidatus Saccharibacteria bacterium]|nr:hypothetical protein [Candidatus Saccharibacteria bacterium]
MVAAAKGQKTSGEFKHPYDDMDMYDYLSRQGLSDAEKSATHNSYKRRGSGAIVTDLRSSERSQRSSNLRSFSNNVTGRNKNIGRRGNEKLRFNGRSRFRRIAPATLITGLLASGGFLFFFSQSALGPHLSSLYTEATDLQFTSYSSRNTRLFKYLLDGGDQIKIGFNAKYKYTTFSPYMKSRLKKNGIEVGTLDANGNFATSSGLSTSKTVLRYNGETIDAASFQTKFASDPGFQEAYYKAKRGRIGGFFDDAADLYYERKGATRDIFDRYKATGDAETDTTNFRKTVSDRVTGADASLNSISRRENEEGEETYDEDGERMRNTDVSGDTPEAKARVMVNDLAGKVSQGGAVACAVLRIGNMAAVTVSAYQMFQSIAYFLSLMEPISKMMAGEGDASAINPVLNFLTTETTSEIDVVNPDGTVTKKTVTGSPLQASGPKLILGNTRPNQSDLSPYSVDTITKAAQTIALSTGATNIACDGVLAANAAISLVANAVPGGTLANFAVRVIVNTVKNVAITGAISAIVSAVIPYVAKIFAGNIFESYTGVPAGELFSLGAAQSNFKLATQGSAYMPASADYIKTQNRQTAVALAQEAELDRRGRSPFDISSQNTFLGSLISKFSYISNQNTLIGHISSIMGTVSSAFNVFNPSASAYDDELSYTSNYQDCSQLDNTVCDIYGTNIVGMDYSTIDLAPDDPTYVSVINPNLDSEGNIIDGSELSKFVKACVERESPWGVLDVNIMNSLQTSLGVVGDNLYILEDVMDIVNAAEDAENRPWGTGEYCQMGDSNPRWNSEIRYYQRFVEDMRITSGMTDDPDANPVVSYEKAYAEQHPIDQSFEGTLARLSGYSKDDISFLLEFARYSNEIAKYNPSERYAFNVKPSFNRYDFSETIKQPETIVSIRMPEFFTDKRSYTV